MARTIAAFVDGRGNNQWGTEGIGSCRRLDRGAYYIEFAEPFRNNPVVTGTIYGDPWYSFDKSVAVIEASPWHCIYFTSNANDVEDIGVMLTIIGE